MDMLEIECCICGYHVYHDVWEAAIDEEFVCRPERSNSARIDVPPSSIEKRLAAALIPFSLEYLPILILVFSYSLI